MLDAQKSSNCWTDLGFKDEFAGNDCDAEGDYDLCIDVDQLLDILDEDPKDDHDASQRFSECSMLTNASQDEAIPGSTTDDNNQPDSGTQVSKGEHPVGGDSAEPIASHTFCDFKPSESGNGVSDGFLDLEANLDVIFNKKVQERSTLSCSPVIGSEANLDLIFNEVEPTTYSRSSVNDNSATYGDWFQLAPGKDASVAEKAGVLLHPCSAASSFSGEKNKISGHRDAFNLSMLQGEYKNPFTHADVLPYSVIENANLVFDKYDTFGENTANTISPLGNSCASMESFMNADTSWNLNCSKSTVYWSSHAMSDYPATFNSMSIDDYSEPDKMNPHSLAGLDMQFSPIQERTYIKEEVGKVPTESACSSNKMELNDQGLRTGTNISELSATHCSDVSGWHYGFDCNDYESSLRCPSFYENGYPVDEKVLTQQTTCPQSGIPANERDIFVKDEKTDDLVSYGKNMWCTYDDTVSRKHFSSIQDKCFTKKIKESLPAVSFSLSNHKAEFCRDEEEDMMVASQRFSHFQDNTQRYGISPDNNGRSDMNTLNWSPSAQSFTSSANQPSSMCSQHSKVSTESIHSTFSERSTIEDDNEVCIIEEMSHPAPSKLSPIVKSTIVTSQRSVMNGNYMGSGGTKSKARDERFILRAALQDLSQSKSEASPPDGVLAVPLLRHQRIALSWMVQKETNSTYCCGGILADDQGLGKTISTISLILKERRPPSSRGNSDVKECKMEALNLDEDEDILLETGRIKQGSDTRQIMAKKTFIKSMNSMVQGKGRPAAGTLVVCPTSVLRQWAEELHSKVTSKANLSVLVYHGSNRTKDPCELAKYDVVLTTYAIVGMEVPKQPIADEDDEEKRNSEHGYSSREFSSGNKRKNPTSSDKKNSKNKKGLDGALIELDVRPLAKVGWFRVVLDEAQSIKNHRTQVARACWGLRAKRRWCLSGTPIQNAIDDLYSYFRFLKYDPYSIYKSFCSTIKVPISRNPANGYRKLQAVLKTIMLRRTKGTLLDGEPIINLPPKLVELKKVDFSKEERDFYSRLEADSRAQFKEYAAAGTVKENYVNILLMLLRLRQACDHPLLVKRFNLRSLWKSSVESAKKLPHDEKKHLLSCLEASLAICGICNDSPEDAVVSKCGHVFCNQCICEHLTGDDNQCPNPNCKVRLNMSSVFSRGTLNSSLYDQPCENESLPCTSSEFEKIAESFHEGLLYNSSKIKAALEVLQSLCKPKDCFSENGSANNILNGNAICFENSSHVHAVEPLVDDTSGKQVLDVRKSSDDNSVQAVGKKAIVFSQWTRMLDLLEACLKSSCIQYRRLDGTMSVAARDKAVKDFNTLPEVSVMIMSLKAASLGLNMVAACYVLLLDLWWNPTTEDQAIDRAHRIGQTRPVTVLRLTVRDTVEDRILALQQKKRQMVASAFGEDENGGRQTRLTVDDLNYLFMT